MIMLALINIQAAVYYNVRQMLGLIGNQALYALLKVLVLIQVIYATGLHKILILQWDVKTLRLAVGILIVE
jgi:hypothetical protein